MSRPRAVLPFLALAIAFITLGVTSNRVFLYVGIVFLVLALSGLLFRRR
jgi:LPXTG-motif cell wall-anchored protein